MTHSGENNLVITAILKRILGEPKDEYVNMVQYEFNCPSSYCGSDVDKFNLGYNSELHIFHCWKCKYKGFVTRLISDFGSLDEVEKAKLIFPKSPKHTVANTVKEKPQVKEDPTCKLPDGFIPLTERKSSNYYKRAIRYLFNRKVDWDTIKKYNIGYTEEGPRKFRIIIPSYNKENQINYYEARSYISSVKPTYLKPDSPNKEDIIFNVKNINFNFPVYLVEGVFDMFPVPNSVPLLGKTISDLLLDKLVENQTKVIICLDEDAKKDAYNLYYRLDGLGLDVYYVEIKNDIAKFYELYGREELVKMLRGHKKLDFNNVIKEKLKIRKKGSMKNVNPEFVKMDFERIKKNLDE